MDKIQFRRDTLANWASANPILAEGEIGYVLDDPNRYKMGDGVKTWDQLPFRGFDGNIVHELGDAITAVISQKTTTDGIKASQALINSLSANMINPDDIRWGGYINGSNVFVRDGAADYFCTSFIAVKPNTQYFVKYVSQSYLSGFEYDSNFNQLSMISHSGIGRGVTVFTTSSECKYIILNFNYSSVTQEEAKNKVFCGTCDFEEYYSSKKYDIEAAQKDNYSLILSEINGKSISTPKDTTEHMVLTQGSDLINTNLFERLNTYGEMSIIVPVWEYSIIDSPIEDVALKGVKFKRRPDDTGLNPWHLGAYSYGDHFRVWTNYANYNGNLVVHSATYIAPGLYPKNSDMINFTISKENVYVGYRDIKATSDATITVEILSVEGNYCEIDVQVIPTLKNSSFYRHNILIYDSEVSSNIDYIFFGFNIYTNAKHAIDLYTLANILPSIGREVEEYEEVTESNGFIQLIKPSLIDPIVSSGYANEKISNPIEGVKVNKINSIKKAIGTHTIFPCVFRSTILNSEYGVWIRKSDYEGKLRFHFSVISPSEAIVYNAADFLLEEINIGASKSISGTDFIVHVKCEEVSGDYYYFSVKYSISRDKEEFSYCDLLPYEYNDAAGAVLDKEYHILCFIGGSNPYFKSQKVSLKNLGGSSKDSVKLCLPNVLYAEYNKAMYIFKNSIISAHNYENYNIQVILDSDVTNGKDYHRYWLYQPKIIGSTKATFYLYDNSRNLLDKKEVTINVTNRTSQPSSKKTVLFIGDSLTFYNRITDEFYRLLTSSDTRSVVKDTLSIYDVVKFPGRGWNNIQLIGTQKQDYRGWIGKTPHEGYSGWQWSNFLTSGSPFFFNGEVNFNTYLSTNGFDTPDIIYIGLGWNDQKIAVENSDGTFDVSAIISNARRFLTILTQQLPDTKVRLWTENVPGTRGGVGNHPYGSNMIADEQRMKLIQLEVAEGYKQLSLEFDNVEIVGATAQIDSEYALQETESMVNSRINLREVLGSDYVHPADSGFFQIADALVSDFVSLI